MGVYYLCLWARSSAGRALRSQRRGQGFDPLRVHQYGINPNLSLFSDLFGFLFNHIKLKMSRVYIGEINGKAIKITFINK